MSITLFGAPLTPSGLWEGMVVPLKKSRVNKCIPNYLRITARIILLAILGANFPIFLFSTQFGQKVDVLLGELGPATCMFGH